MRPIFLNAALVLLSLSWGFRIPFVGDARNGWFPLVLAGLILLVAALAGPTRSDARPVAPDSRSGRIAAGVLFGLGLVALLLFPPGAPHGFLLLLVGAAVLSLRPGSAWIGRGATACAVAGLILVVQRLLVPVLEIVAAHGHSIPWLAWLFYPALALVNPATGISGGRLFMTSWEEIYPGAVSFERLAGAPLVMTLVAIWLWCFLGRAPRRSWIGATLALLGYAAVRFIFISLAVVQFDADWLYWRPEAVLISLLPLAFVLPRSSPAWPDAARTTVFDPRPEHPLRPARLVAIGGGALLIAVGLTFHDPGQRKAGRVLFDEKHSNWEWTTEAYDQNWYGQKSGYNYYSLQQYIRHFYRLDVGMAAFTPSLLDSYDVVVIKTPTVTFPEEELRALEQYVRKGGGLFLIGDHTNVFGTSSNLNPLATRFGLRFNYDSTYDLPTGALSYYRPPTLLAHPCTVHMPGMLFATSCSIDSRPWDDHMIVGYGLRAVPLDYSQRNYFPQVNREKDYESGFVNQMVGRRLGRGRVAGFTDSTVFSNFFMFMPGKPELFLGTLEWLNRTNRWGFVNPILLLAGLIVVGAALRGGVAPRMLDRMLLAAGVVAGVSLGLQLADACKRSAYAAPVARDPITRVAFDLELSRIHMPVWRLTARNQEPGLSTFFVWTQRLNIVPSAHPRLADALGAARAVVIANPSRAISVREASRIVQYVQGGGRVLLMFDPVNGAENVHELLGMFRMKVGEPDTGPSGASHGSAVAATAGPRLAVAAAPNNRSGTHEARGVALSDTVAVVNARGERICRATAPGTITGGQRMLAVPPRGTVLAWESLGQGYFLAFADFTMFTDAVMGGTSVVPTREQREIYELEYQLLEILTGDREPTRIEPFSGRPRVNPLESIANPS